MRVKNARVGGGKLTYEDMFYRENQKGNFVGVIKGFPIQRASWCKKLKYEHPTVDIRRRILQDIERKAQRGDLRVSDIELQLVYGRTKTSPSQKNSFTDYSSRERERKAVQYLGIAADEPLRIARYEKRDGFVLPLVLAGWDEAYCRKWCEENDLLSPIYTTATRGGCWFCHNQGIDQLRLLRRNYPEYWQLLLKWDKDSPVTFHSDGHTVHDFEKRFAFEDEKLIPTDVPFRWAMLDDELQYRLF